MSAVVIFGVDFRAKTRPAQRHEQTLEQLAVEIMNVAICDPGPCIGDAHEAAIYESSLGFIDKEPA